MNQFLINKALIGIYSKLPLTETEQYLFSLTMSQAKTPLSQRHAIVGREDLLPYRPFPLSVVKPEIESLRLEKFEFQLDWRKDRSHWPQVPRWVTAADLPPISVPEDEPTGKIMNSLVLEKLAFERIFYKTRKKRIYPGDATASAARMRIKHVWLKMGTFKSISGYHADYLSVVSPDGSEVVFQLKEEGMVYQLPLYNGCVTFEGCRLQIFPGK